MLVWIAEEERPIGGYRAVKKAASGRAASRKGTYKVKKCPE